jgi:hypothetical protein
VTGARQQERIETRGLQGDFEADQERQGGGRGPGFELGNGDTATANLGGELGLREVELLAVVADTHANAGTGHPSLLSARILCKCKCHYTKINTVTKYFFPRWRSSFFNVM